MSTWNAACAISARVLDGSADSSAAAARMTGAEAEATAASRRRLLGAGEKASLRFAYMSEVSRDNRAHGQQGDGTGARSGLPAWASISVSSSSGNSA